MIHAIIVDDEAHGLRSLELLLENCRNEVKLVGSTTDAHEAIAMINNYRPDVVFLDISMPGMDGFEVLERLQFKNFYLVFTTAHRSYALRALKQGATDYLLKPVDRAELQDAINKIKERITQRQVKPDVYEVIKKISEVQNMRVLLPTRVSTEYVLPVDIVYIEANSNHAIVSLTNGQRVEVISSLKEFEQQLCRKDINFMRIHNSYIINVDYVARYIKDDGGLVVLRDKKTIPVSRQKKDEFLKMINFPE